MSELKARQAYFSEDDYERGTHKICARVSDCGYDRRNDWWSYAFEDEVYLKSEADKVISELEEERRWRKFSEETPEHHQWILVFCPNHSQFTTGVEVARWDNRRLKLDVEYEVYTYWMPLPSAPKEAK